MKARFLQSLPNRRRFGVLAVFHESRRDSPAVRLGSCARFASRTRPPRTTITPHAGTGFRYAINPHRGHAMRATPCSRIGRSAVPAEHAKSRLGPTCLNPRRHLLWIPLPRNSALFLALSAHGLHAAPRGEDYPYEPSAERGHSSSGKIAVETGDAASTAMSASGRGAWDRAATVSRWIAKSVAAETLRRGAVQHAHRIGARTRLSSFARPLPRRPLLPRRLLPDRALLRTPA